MTRYLISFNDGDMTFPEEDLPAVGRAAHDVMREAMAAGVWIVGGGFSDYKPQVVSQAGAITDGPLAQSSVHMGGFTVVEVDSLAAAHMWAEKIAVACRCDQEVRAIMDDPEQEELQAR